MLQNYNKKNKPPRKNKKQALQLGHFPSFIGEKHRL